MKFYITAEDRYIDIDQAFTLNSIQYPAGCLRSMTPDERTSLGLQEVVTVGERKDTRYYFVSEELVGAELWIINTPKTIESIKGSKLSELAAYRYGVETGGVTLDGVEVLTDRESQGTLTGAYVTALINPATAIDWKGKNGWTQINKNMIVALTSAVATHVQCCFTREKVLADSINALTDIDAVIAYDIATAWAAL